MFAGPHLIGMNLHNNAHLMPQIVHQMLTLLFTFHHGSAFLSIYESNSKDATGEILKWPTSSLAGHCVQCICVTRGALSACDSTVAWAY